MTFATKSVITGKPQSEHIWSALPPKAAVTAGGDDGESGPKAVIIAMQQLPAPPTVKLLEDLVGANQ
jgi:hypothetical protein